MRLPRLGCGEGKNRGRAGGHGLALSGYWVSGCNFEANEMRYCRYLREVIELSQRYGRAGWGADDWPGARPQASVRAQRFVASRVGP